MLLHELLTVHHIDARAKSADRLTHVATIDRVYLAVLWRLVGSGRANTGKAHRNYAHIVDEHALVVGLEANGGITRTGDISLHLCPLTRNESELRDIEHGVATIVCSQNQLVV